MTAAIVAPQRRFWPNAATAYRLGYAIPMLVGTIGTALSFVIAIALGPGDQGQGVRTGPGGRLMPAGGAAARLLSTAYLKVGFAIAELAASPTGRAIESAMARRGATECTPGT